MATNVPSDALIKKGVKPTRSSGSAASRAQRCPAQEGSETRKTGDRRGRAVLSDALIKKGVKRSRHRDTDRHRSAQRCPDQEGSETPALGGEVVRSEERRVGKECT